MKNNYWYVLILAILFGILMCTTIYLVTKEEVGSFDKLPTSYHSLKGTEVKEKSKELKIVDEVNEVDEEPVLNVIPMEFTFYTASCKGCMGLTRWGGHDVRDTIYVNGYRVIATDPNVIPPYSIVEFDLEGDYLKAMALDTGGDIKGNRIDLLVNTYNEAIKLGRKNIDVKILRYGE